MEETVVIAKMSSKGQIVIPEEMRNELGLNEGSVFALFGHKGGDSILLKKLEIPSATKAFSELTKWGIQHAKEKNLDVSPEKIVERQHKYRREKWKPLLLIRMY